MTRCPILGKLMAMQALCPVFGSCGGCAYQDLPYEEELAIKENSLRDLLGGRLGLAGEVFEPILASPIPYHYRHRLDITLRRLRSGELIFGFQHEGSHQLVPISSCAIARPEVSDAIPAVFKEAAARLPANYRTANVVLKTSQEGRIVWGGIGGGSLKLAPEDYLWTEIDGRKIFYSLDTFFQANLAILPLFMERMRNLMRSAAPEVLYDLYAGVGFFGVLLADLAGKVVLIEESAGSVELMRYNVTHHRLQHIDVRPGKVEQELAILLRLKNSGRAAAVIDPPRGGLSDAVRKLLLSQWRSGPLFYLSCSPLTLGRDLEAFRDAGWKIEKIMPLDFFPRTRHLEVLAWIHP